MPPLSSDEYHQLATVRHSCVYITLGGRTVDNAMKPDIGQEARVLPTPPAFDVPVRRVPVGILPHVWSGKTRMWLPDGEKKFEDMFIRFDRIHERDGRTDGQTARRHKPRLASRGKNNLQHRAADILV